MSGIYIPSMDMPTSCLDCGFKINCDDCEGYECFCSVLHRNIGYLRMVPSNYRLGDCPLVPVYTHGRVMSETVEVDVPIYDEEELHYGCVVQVLRNSVTGETSIGWWKEDDDDI